MTARCGEEPTQRGSRLHPAGERPGWCGLDRLRSRLAPHHSASWEDEHFAKFGAVLIRMARREAEQHQRRRVVGVYVGWRGESAAVPFLPLLTVWTRYSTAERIGDAAVEVGVLRCFAHENTTRAGIADRRVRHLCARRGLARRPRAAARLDPPLGKCLEAEGRECVHTITLTDARTSAREARPARGTRRRGASPVLGTSLLFADHLAEKHWPDRQAVDLDAERLQRILDGGGQRRGRTHPSPFAAALDAMLGVG